MLSGLSCDVYLILSRIVPGMGASSVNWSSVSPVVVMSTSRSKSPAAVCVYVERERERVVLVSN